MFTIQIEKIKSRGLSLSGEVEASTLAGLDTLISTGALKVNRPVTYSFSVFRAGGMITIQGSVATGVVLSCGRCLESFDLPVKADFDLVYATQMPEVADEDDEGLELSADDLGIVLLTEEEIDLSEPLVEQLLLCLPFQAICRKGCKGLCPQCGVDLNQSACKCDQPEFKCDQPEFDTRFSALKNFKIDSDK